MGMGDFKNLDPAEKWLSSESKMVGTGFNFFTNLYRFPVAPVF